MTERNFVEELKGLSGLKVGGKVLRRTHRLYDKVCSTKRELNTIIEYFVTRNIEPAEYFDREFNSLEEALKESDDKGFLHIECERSNPDEGVKVSVDYSSFTEISTGRVLMYSDFSNSTIEDIMKYYTGSLDMEEIFKDKEIPNAKNKVYLANSFSLQMLPSFDAVISARPVSPVYVPNNFISCVGHEDTARVISNMLDTEVPLNRTPIKLDWGDELYVAQFTGGRLPEGVSELPEGVKLQFVRVTAEPCFEAYGDVGI